MLYSLLGSRNFVIRMFPEKSVFFAALETEDREGSSPYYLRGECTKDGMCAELSSISTLPSIVHHTVCAGTRVHKHTYACVNIFSRVT
jgi:hypothetical protein